ncbi:hypothetical protein D3C83_146440 [compost metagenome]
MRRRRGNRDAISRRVLRRFREEAPRIELAYPTSRTYRTELDMQRFGEIPEPEPEREPEDRPRAG